jgi:hypothetical protein
MPTCRLEISVKHSAVNSVTIIRSGIFSYHYFYISSRFKIPLYSASYNTIPNSHIGMVYLYTFFINRALITDTTRIIFLIAIQQVTASVVKWQEPMAADPEARVRFLALSNFLRSSASGTGSTQPREYNWEATWKKNGGSCLKSRDWGRRGSAALTTRHPVICKSWQ